MRIVDVFDADRYANITYETFNCKQFVEAEREAYYGKEYCLHVRFREQE